MAKRPQRKKHIPQRTCVGCRQVLAKRELTRIVRTPEGIFPDPGGKLPGRGAYLHNQQSCWTQGLKGGLARSLKTSLTPEDRERLAEFAADLEDDRVIPDTKRV